MPNPAVAQAVTARRLRPTGRAWWLFIIGVVTIVLAEVFGINQLRFAGLVIALLPVLMLLARFVLKPRLELERSVYPTTVVAGDRVRVVAEVRNRSIFGLEPSSYLDIVTGTDRNEMTGVLPAVATRLHPREGRSRRRIAYGLSRMRRGISQVGPLFLENVDGLGLTRRMIRVGEAVEVEVWPHVHDVEDLEVPALRTGNESDVALGRSGDADDVVTREYRRSDALRRVHWRATARAGELRVRQEEHHTEVVATLVLDTAMVTREPLEVRASRDLNVLVDDNPDPTDPAFELSVSVTASVLSRLHSLGYDTELFETFQDDPDQAPLSTRTSAGDPLNRVMRQLMLVQPVGPDAESEVAEVLFHATRVGRGPIFFVTRGDRDADPAMLDLAGYGEPAVVVICGAGGEREAALAREHRAAGWEVIWMNARARDPWSTVRRIGVRA